MSRSSLRFVLPVVAALFCASTAHAWHVSGRAFCQDSALPYAWAPVQVQSTDGGTPFFGTGTCDGTGYYYVELPDAPRCYSITLITAAGDVVTSPSGGVFSFCTTAQNFWITENFTVNSPTCQNGACWLTAGGAKFDVDLGLKAGHNTVVYSWGGNVYPGCSSTAGDGGNWNMVDHVKRLHFQGTQIHVIRCGNVDGIPPGSDSPTTPFNFIEFEGTGTLKGIKGNKADYGTVYFWAHCEDRNEPGSNGVDDGTQKDRNFLKVFTNPADPNGSVVELVDVDGDPATVDPIMITDGNMQIHVSSCDFPPTGFALTKTTGNSSLAPSTDGPGDGELSFAPIAPNPARERVMLAFHLPKDANVDLSAFDVSGRMVRTIARGMMPAGDHRVAWTLNDARNGQMRIGVYFVRLTVNGQSFSRIMTVTP